MVRREGSVDLGIDHHVPAGKTLREGFDKRPRRAVSGIPCYAERAARRLAGAFRQQPIEIRTHRVDGLNRAGPVLVGAVRGDPGEGFDVLATISAVDTGPMLANIAPVSTVNRRVTGTPRLSSHATPRRA